MRSLMLATTIGTAQALAVANKSKKPAVQALMESAAHMLKNGATPEVVTFAETTLDEVTETVMPAIISESENDQAFINNLHARFELILSELETINVRIHGLDVEEAVDQPNADPPTISLATQHKNCRDEEHSKCYGDDVPECDSMCGTAKRPCEMSLYQKWEDWVTAENNLKEYHEHISLHFCPTEANGTTMVFRDSATTYMHEYMARKIICDEKLVEYDEKAECCVTAHRVLDEKSDVCNGLQTQLEEKACEHADAIQTALTTFYRDYAQALSAYNCAEEEVRQLEKDRKKEWVTLEVVRCLLSRIRAQNGVPCDESTNQVTEEIGFCEDRHSTDVCTLSEEQFADLSAGFNLAADGSEDLTRDVAQVSWTLEDVRKLCINYPPAPPQPDPCDDRHNVVGRCLPTPIATPCTEQWSHYADLPGYPEATFTETNPGCNAYPACTACVEQGTPSYPALEWPEYAAIDTCPGYTVDGCTTSNGGASSENPLTYIRSVEGRADVRCCSTDDDGESECFSQDFEPVDGFPLHPVDFQTPGGVTQSCYFDVTYQDALLICHESGKRICTVDEMASNGCCGTGCWHDRHPIWVDNNGVGAVEYLTHAQAEEQNAARNDLEHRRGQQLGQESGQESD